jgi:nucleoside-diphosphate-sugar epimerase
MNVLVTGANGFVGYHLCHFFRDRGWNVVGAVRSSANIRDRLEGIEWTEVGDIRRNPDWESILQGVHVVVHLSARVHVMKEDSSDPLGEFRRVNVAATEFIARAAAKAGVRRFLFLSSIGAVANLSSKLLTEESPCRPESEYGKSKLEAEKKLMQVSAETGLEIVILRPPLIYGPFNPGNFVRLLRLVDRGYPLPFHSINNLRSFLFIGNLVDAIGLCASHPKAVGEIFHATDDEDVSTPELIHRIASVLNRPPRLFYFPPSVIRLAGRIVGKSAEVERLLGSLVIDSDKIKRVLSWKPPYTMEQGLKKTARWYQSNEYAK